MTTYISFSKDTNGSLSILFAGTLIVLIATIGSAVDISRAFHEQQKLQQVADAAALSAAKLMGVEDNERTNHAKTYFENFLTSRVRSGSKEKATAASDIVDGNVVLKASSQVPTYFLGIVGFGSLNVGARSVAMTAQPPDADIALVLDYSGSMNANGKYQAMRDAAIKLIDDLTSPPGSEQAQSDLKISLVPFSEYVYSEIQTDYIADIHSSHFGRNVRACLDSRRYPYAVQSSTPVPSVNGSRWPAPGLPEGYTKAGSSPQDGGDVNGTIDSVNCTPQRSGDDDDDDESSSTYTRDECQRTYNSFEKLQQQSETLSSDFATTDSQCSYYRDRNLLVQPLTNDFNTLKSQLIDMRPVRLTNIALGLEMGWHTVTANAPFIADDGTQNRLKIIVLLTDGRQTVGGFGPNDKFNINQADTNTASLCTSIKGTGIKMITIGYDLGDQQNVLKMLKTCASDADSFFDARTNENMSEAFEKIANSFMRPVSLVE